MDESKPYTQLVWIPRYAYKITSQYHTGGTTAGNIDIVFINTNNKGTDKTTGESTYTGNEVICVKANVTSWRNIKIGDAFTTCLNMNKSGNPYGLSTSDSVVDPHMVKNDEWGAVAYLSQSSYGKNAEVYINNSSTYITGNAGSTAIASSASGVTHAYNTTEGQELRVLKS